MIPTAATELVSPAVAKFIAKWRKSSLKESAGAHEYFIDLCRLLDQPTPAESDPDGSWFCFERGAKKTGGGDGWADVWRKGCFAWEFKGKHKDLTAAFVQLQRYAIALENPPLLVVSDFDTIIIHSNFTNTPQETHVIHLDDLAKPEVFRTIRWMFTEPERLTPGATTSAITEDAAGRFADLAQRLRNRGYPPERVAHFLNRMVFCLFAEDAGLLPNRLLVRSLEAMLRHPAQSASMLRSLFGAMAHGGLFGADVIDHFNGGLFEDDDALPLEEQDIKDILASARLDWSAIEPSIFGTLFERGLDPDKRSQLGAHYTDPTSIMRIVNPVVVEPLLVEWAQSKEIIEAFLANDKGARPLSSKKKETSKPRQQAQDRYKSFMERLGNFRVLDPACGSGNFLYLALQALKDIELRVSLEAEQLGLEREFVGMNVGVQCVMGIELNAYAAELARLTVWIGEIQWTLRHGAQPSKQPILKNLERIECRDAIINTDGSEAEWPFSDCIVGNPPFLGDRKMRAGLGDEYVDQLRRAYESRVPPGADLVCYWFEKAKNAVVAGAASSAGLVATNSIRGGKNRVVLDAIAKSLQIFAAWADEPWILDGAAVRVSIVAFARRSARGAELDGNQVSVINSDLTGTALDFTVVRKLRENVSAMVHGSKKIGEFELRGEEARDLVVTAGNPNGKPNSDVLSPCWNGADVAGRNRDFWIIDFGMMSQAEAAEYERPFALVEKRVKPDRLENRNPELVKYWWRHGGPRPALRNAMPHLTRVLATPAVTKHRIWVWVPKTVLPDAQLMVALRDDDTTFGLLQSRLHTLWTLRLCSWVGVGNDPRYTPTTTFETFPFPNNMTPNFPAAQFAGDERAVAISIAARKLNELRDKWLNPPEWTTRVAEVVPGYPDRILPVDEGAMKALRLRTLTNLYNSLPTWLVNAHNEVDAAVAAAYGWPDYSPKMSDDEILRRLLELNLHRAGPPNLPAQKSQILPSLP